MQPAPSAVYHYSDAGGGNAQNKVNAIFQAAKKDLLKVIQIQVEYTRCVAVRSFPLME